MEHNPTLPDTILALIASSIPDSSTFNSLLNSNKQLQTLLRQSVAPPCPFHHNHHHHHCGGKIVVSSKWISALAISPNGYWLAIGGHGGGDDEGGGGGDGIRRRRNDNSHHCVIHL